MPAGVAFDGSVWVTAGSSIGLVLGSLGMTVLGGIALSKRLSSLELGPPPESRQASQRQRSMPLSKSEDRTIADMPAPPTQVDTMQQEPDS